jgi:hypothetical protein
MRPSLLLAGLLLMSSPSAAAPAPAPAAALPEGHWPEEQVAALLARTETLRLAPDLSRLTPGEARAVKSLLAAGGLFQRLYEESRHPQAREALARLERLDRTLGSPRRTQDLLALYRLFQGPVATTLQNARAPFLPVAPETPARNVYPPDATRQEVDAFLAAHPARRGELLDERGVVRRVTRANLDRDLATLRRHPVLAGLHPDVEARLKGLRAQKEARGLYGVPYAVAYGDTLVEASGHLREAAAALEAEDAEFARYLRNRARDLLTNDYESGDAAWVTGRFRRLNLQAGAYETYDDALYGTKAFHGFSLLLLDEPATEALRKNLGGLQAVEDALPSPAKKRVREDIPVGVYEIIADFGQARGTNTATILPNDPLFSRRYGRTILLRGNVLRDPTLFANDARVWKAAMQDAHAAELVPAGNLLRTLWHEVGHYLGVERDRQGRTLDVALEEHADALEEMKSDLVSLFALHAFHRNGTLSAEDLRAVQASGVRRTLQNARPRADQPYQTMQLAQFNFFLEQGLLVADPATGRLAVRTERYLPTVTALLEQVLALQHGGDKAAAQAFFTRWGAWTPELHEKLAARIREAQGARFRLVRYGALGE